MSNSLEHIDELYRQRFESFEAEPPQEAWGRIKEKLHPSGGGASGGLGKTFLLSIISMMSVVAIVFFILNPFNNANPSLASGDYIAYLDNADDQSSINHNQLPTETQTSAPVKEEETSSTENDNELNLITETDKDVKSEQKSANIRQTSEELIEIEKKYISEWKFVNPKFNFLNSKKTSRFRAGDDEYYDAIRNKGYWKIGGSINPEIVFYPNDSINNNRNYNFNVDISYHKNNFFVETGLGISMARDEGRYFVDYESYEYAGSYNDLIGITYDTTDQGEIVPIYHSEEVDIYDSIRHLKIEKSVNTYTYLNIPLLFGYEKQFKRFGYYLKAGPNFSLLINKKIPGTQLPKDITVFDVDARLAERIKTNWQVLVGAGITYQLSNNTDIAIEPTFRYYLNSAYDRSYVATKHPFAFGIRAGIKFRIK